MNADAEKQPRTDDPLPELRAQLGKGVRAAEALRLVGLAQAAGLEEARTAALRRERARIADKHGEHSDAARAVAGRLARHQRNAGELRAEAEATRRRAPDAIKGAMVVYGRVVDEGRRGLDGYVVRAVAEDGARVAETWSDDDGRFSLEIPEPPAAVLLEVAAERDAEPVRRVEQAQAVVLGGVVYRELVVAGAEPGSRAAR